MHSGVSRNCHMTTPGLGRCSHSRKVLWGNTECIYGQPAGAPCKVPAECHMHKHEQATHHYGRPDRGRVRRQKAPAQPGLVELHVIKPTLESLREPGSPCWLPACHHPKQLLQPLKMSALALKHTALHALLLSPMAAACWWQKTSACDALVARWIVRPDHRCG